MHDVTELSIADVEELKRSVKQLRDRTIPAAALERASTTGTDARLSFLRGCKEVSDSECVSKLEPVSFSAFTHHTLVA